MKTLKTILILTIILLNINPSYSQEVKELTYEPTQIKADIDTLIAKLLDVHPTYLNYYTTNNLQSKIDSIKNSISLAKKNLIK